MIRRGLVVLVAAMGALVGVAADAADGTVERLYVLDCGQNIGKDQSRWSPGVNEGKVIWINHDKPQSATLRYAPASYE